MSGLDKIACFVTFHKPPATQAELEAAIVSEGFTCRRCKEFVRWDETPRRLQSAVLDARERLAQ